MAPYLIFVLTYLVIAIGRLPGFRIDRTGAAVIGAAMMVAFGVLSLDEAYRSIDWNTITLLLGMMIVVANLRLSGFFRLVSSWAVRHATQPWLLLTAITFVAGVLSAFFVNDTICLVLTPMVAEVVTHLKRRPLPYLLAVALASNIGSTATITGNPQNMMIGSFSQIPYIDFLRALAPVAVLGLCCTVGLLLLLYRDEFRSGQKLQMQELPHRVSWPVLGKALTASALIILFFFLGQPAAKVALVGGASLLVTRRVKPEKVYHQIDWTLLLLFCGLFVVVAGIEKTTMVHDLLALARHYPLEHTAVLSGITAVLSNLVSNVPAVLVLKPFVQQFAHPAKAWLTLAMASTLAGNFTLVGSVANLIVVQKSRQYGVEITFWEYFRAGAPLTVITIALGVWLLH